MKVLKVWLGGGIFCCFYHDFFSLWLFHGFQGLGSEEGLLSTDLTCSFSLFSPQTLHNTHHEEKYVVHVLPPADQSSKGNDT